MKNKLVKGFATLSLAAALAISGVTTMGTGLETVEAAKIVNNKTLAAVTGIGYNTENNRLYWNKVPGATRYRVEIAYSEYNIQSITTSEVYYSVDLPKGTYKITIEAMDQNSFYVMARDVKWSGRPEGWSSSTGDYDYYQVGNERLYTFYGYPSSKTETQIVVTEDDARVEVTDRITVVPGMMIKETTESYIIIKPTTKIKLNSGERVIYEVANNAEFKVDSKKGLVCNTYNIWYYNDENLEKTVYFSNFEPGETIYIRARVYNENYGNVWVENMYYGQWENNTPMEQRYSAYTKTITCAVKKPKVTSIRTTTTANSVTLGVNTNGGAVTGYQFERKVGSKWVTLETQTDPFYVDSALVKNTKYQYRARAYAYNQRTNKTIWTDWYTVETTTWGSQLNVKAGASSATSVKLTWKPVTGAEGYEIYRYDNGSSAMNKDKGVWVDGTDRQYLVKTFKSSKTKSYTDKKLNKNATYNYVVRAYRTVGKQKVYLEGWASASLRASALYTDDVTTYVNGKGQTIATWGKKTGIKGYYVEQYDRTTGEYIKVKTLKASATSYTFPAVAVGSQSVSYRIRPYDATTVYGGADVSVSATLAAPTGVKATKTATGVKITWKPVAGADYYMVYRGNTASYSYDKTRKTYNYYGGYQVVYDAAVNTTNCHPEFDGSSCNDGGTYRTSMITGTSVEDKTVTYKVTSRDDKDQPIKIGETTDGKTLYQTEDCIYNEGPEAGGTYYYYVVAYANPSNGNTGATVVSSDSKAAKVVYTNAIAKKVSKITSAKSTKKGQATISYKKVKGVDGYAIYRSTKKNGTYVLAGTTTKTTFTDASAPAGKKCYYKVASYVKGEKKANIYSAKTAAKEVKVK